MVGTVRSTCDLTGGPRPDTATAESAAADSKCISDASADRQKQVQHGGSQQDSAHV
jgi:hypothetical protein